MSFHEIRFPSDLSFGSIGGPERRTDIVTLANGYEERNTPWAHSRRRYDAGLGMRSLADVERLLAFFEARKGQLYAFRWKDWADYRSGSVLEEPGFEDQVIGIGDGQTDVFQLVKTYASGGSDYVRPVVKPVSGTVTIGLQGDVKTESIDWDVDLTTGLITFASPPPDGATVTAGFEFDVPVRFDTDAIRVSVETFSAGQVPEVPVVEVRL